MRSKDNHPAKAALDRLFKYADTLGVSIRFFGPRTLVYYKGEEYEMREEARNSQVAAIPPVMGYKLVKRSN